jgi:hypothetical protein
MVSELADKSQVLKSGHVARPKQLGANAPPGQFIVPSSVIILVEGIVSAVVTFTVE